MQPVLSDVPNAGLTEICHRFRVRRLALFGSILRNDFGPSSDIDVLVEFETGFTPGLAFFELQDALSALFRRTVDLNTAAFLSSDFHDAVLTEAQSIYDAA